MGTLTYTTLGGIVAAAPNVASDVTTAFTQAQTSINNVEAAQIVAATVTDAKLASPNNTVWRSVLATPAQFGGSNAAGTFWFTAFGGNAVGTGVASGSGGAYTFVPTAASYLVAGKTTTFRLSAALTCNATALGTTATFGVYPVTVCLGGSGVVGYTLGAVVAGSTCAFTGVVNSIEQVYSSTFTLSPTTNYVVGCVLAGTTSAAHVSCTTAQLQMSHV